MTGSDVEVELGHRARQRMAAHERVLRACAELAVRHRGFQDPEQFTYARIAQLAGMSERTVYRLFPTKQDLVAAFERENVLSGGRPFPDDPHEFSPFLRTVVRDLAAEFPTPDRQTPLDNPDDSGRDRRDDAIAAGVRPFLGVDVTASRQAAIVAVLRRLLSVRSVVETVDRFPTVLVDAAAAHAWAIDLIVAALERGEGPAWPDQ